MKYDLVPSRLLSFPSLQLPSLWEDEDWINTPSASGGLSVSEDDQHVYVEASLPGIDPQNIDMTFHDGYLWVKGEVKEEQKDPKRKYYRESAKAFSYRIAVPGDIDAAQDPVASYKHGVMSIMFNKSPKSQPKKIQVKLQEDK